MSIASANKFCSACGNALLETAVVCPKCGSPTAKYRPEPVHVGKSKTTAVVLAVFLGIWSWLYTYKVNAHKFWITLSLAIALLVTIAIVVFQEYLATTYESQSQLEALGDILNGVWQIFAFATWLWALLDNATKPQSFYSNYGRKP